VGRLHKDLKASEEFSLALFFGYLEKIPSMQHEPGSAFSKWERQTQVDWSRISIFPFLRPGGPKSSPRSPSAAGIDQSF
jgi:hypothetical protein